jgi:hypothetical protein
MNLIIFSKNLKHLMRCAKLSREDLKTALRLDPKSTRIDQWLSARAAPRWEQAIDLCNVLGYYDIYKMFTVDLSKQAIEKHPLPYSVTIAFTNIQEIVLQALRGEKAARKK